MNALKWIGGSALATLAAIAVVVFFVYAAKTDARARRASGACLDAGWPEMIRDRSRGLFDERYFCSDGRRVVPAPEPTR